MIDLREHGGIFGSAGYKKNDYIPSWKLSLMVQDIGNFPRLSAYAYNDYRPSIKYDKSTDYLYFGAGALTAYTKGGAYIGRMIVGNTIYETEIVGDLIFSSSRIGVFKLNKKLDTYTQAGIRPARGLIKWNDGKVYAFDKSSNRIFPFNTDGLGSMTWGTLITLSGVVGEVNSFNIDNNYFYLGNTTGKIQVFDLTGKLVNTFDITTTKIDPLYIRSGYIYFTSGKTVYKINISTGAIVWSNTLITSDGELSGELAFDNNSIFAPALTTSVNMLVVRDTTGETEYKGQILKSSTYGDGDSKMLYGIDIVDSIAYMTHMVGVPPGGGYYFNTIVWAERLKLVG